ncbi:MAG TPA: hypothetical protein VG410_08165 [Solirubrobacteraceae bacterium]|nr:hypothetical protein [Solirubrobacteraceae bacterium]
MVAAICAAALAAPSAGSAGDPLCLANYGSAPARAAASLRFGIDPGLAGSAGNAQLPSVPDDPARDLAAVEQLRPKGRVLVVRLNRLFWSAGDRGIASFRRLAAGYTRAGFEIELQVRYHPSPTEVGNLQAWKAYVRHVVDVLGSNPHVTAMTITNEVNISDSPNTSDGYYRGAEQALVAGIEVAHAEAAKRGYTRLRFGFTYAYRFSPAGDAALFQYLAVHGGARFRRALGFVGVDVYPGTIYPPKIQPGQSYGTALSRALGTVRDCYLRIARIAAATPIWITENGVPTGTLSGAAQAAALTQLVDAAHAYSKTFNVTDYRWFNLRDSTAQPLGGATFSSDGLLRADYTHKPAFSAYRELIEKFGTAAGAGSPVRSRRRIAGSQSGPVRGGAQGDTRSAA